MKETRIISSDGRVMTLENEFMKAEGTTYGYPDFIVRILSKERHAYIYPGSHGVGECPNDSLFDDEGYDLVPATAEEWNTRVNQIADRVIKSYLVTV